MAEQSGSNNQLFLGIGIGVIVAIILLALFFFLNEGFSMGGQASPEPPAVGNIETTATHQAQIGTETAEAAQTATTIAEIGTPTPADGAVSTSTPTPTPTPTVEGGQPPDGQTITPVGPCNPNSLSSIDIGCVTSDRDLVEHTQDNQRNSLPALQPTFLLEDDTVHVKNEGRATLNFFGGTVVIENGSEIMLEDAGGVSGLILFLFNRGSLVGDFESDDDRKLSIKLLNGATVNITGTQFFIDVNTDEDWRGDKLVDENSVEAGSGRAVIGNLSGGVTVIEKEDDETQAWLLEERTMTFLDAQGDFVLEGAGLLVVDMPDLSLKEIDEFNQGSYLISLDLMTVYNGPSDNFLQVGAVARGQFVEILGRDSANEWWAIECGHARLSESVKECWVLADSLLSYPVNTDKGIDELKPLYEEPTLVPTHTPTVTSTPTQEPVQIPQLISPQDETVLFQEASVCADTIPLTWEPVKQATHYEIRLLHFTKIGGSNEYSWSPLTSTPIFSQNENGVYDLSLRRCELICWQVQALSGERMSGYSAFNRFYFTNNQPQFSVSSALAPIQLPDCPKLFKEIDIFVTPELINPIVVPIIITPVFTLPGD